MASSRPATITFFRGGGTDTESDEDDSFQATTTENAATDEVFPENGMTMSEDEGLSPPRTERLSSIYDSFDEPALIRSDRQRTESESNFIPSPDTSIDDDFPMVIYEDHYGRPEDLTLMKEIDGKIERLKSQIFSKMDSDPEKQELIDKLVSLQLRKSELVENEFETDDQTTKLIYRHEFKYLESKSSTGTHCEVCGQIVWGVIQTWFVCTYCDICCHEKCLNSVRRMCAIVKVQENGRFCLDICPDVGLMSQNYRCHECKAAISNKPGGVQPRQCDYTGLYYCHSCHWEDEALIPARIIHNWDFEPRKVCRATKQYLALMRKKPILNVEELNPRLFNFVEELREMKRLRQELLTMKMYFMSCQQALKSKLLLLLESRQHFVENVNFYTLADLIALFHEKLIPAIVSVHASFSTHIKVDCDTCRGKGYICEICNRNEILFAFDNICATCEECSNVFHKYCYNKVKSCQRCERRKRRFAETERKKSLIKQIEQSV